ncbi:MAG TPA: arylsulfatase [Caulobacteraceae bacterium]|nr:arylsulfatase [Caulobacteraceae bacterium]
MLRPPRHVIFVLTDDQGYPPIGANGHPFVKTPNLDRFHAEAVRFEQFHSGTTCAPTRAGLLTGHYCNSTGVWHTVGGRSLLRADEWTLANALGEAGWRTGVFGKWHLGDAYPYRPQDRGFARSIVHGGGGIGQRPDWWGNDYFDDTYLVDGVPTPFEGYCTDVFFAEALRFIEADPEAPSFCFISTNAPHSPFNVPARYLDLYRGRTETEAYARFLGMITCIDENFGALRDRLAALGLEDDTLLIFASDNGQCNQAAGPEPRAYNAGMRGLKGSMYEGGHRVPLVLRWPAGGLAGGREVRTNTAYIDLMPTLLDLCQVEAPAERTFHGRSLAGLARGEAPGPAWTRRVLVTDTQRVPRPIKWRQSCVLRGDWRLINGEALYDLAADPGQRRDVAVDHPAVVAELRAAYEAWWTLCERQADAEIPISIGDETAAVVRLTSHDLRNDAGDGVWNQGQVRRGEACAGYWEVKIERAGLYEFALRRWPAEAGHALRAGVDEDAPFRRDAIAEADWSLYRGGAALPIDTARIEVGGREAGARVADGDVAALLRVELEACVTSLRGWFAGEGLSQSPYYVEARLLTAKSTDNYR